MPTQHISQATGSLIDELKLTLPADLSNIQGEWSGDEGGILEDRGMAANEAQELFNRLIEIIDELS